ncbi:hypothetical protein OEZ85_010486 [Tetradesmus obliquus]|uniref:Protein kinase domain-containing protein n=1 Tax=Tetradesmus obliquus TaxID=3088 RepID=A0ABY8TPJ9_TETOB|nr:hypothetical protein OEZ85_010486 [Tetradesmus obliquus]
MMGQQAQTKAKGQLMNYKSRPREIGITPAAVAATQTAGVAPETFWTDISHSCAELSEAAGYSLHPLAVDKLSVAECVLGSYCFSPRSSGAGAELAGVSAMQQELESIQAELERHEARLEEVRAGIHDAKASNNREEWQQLQQENVELLGVIRELQAEKNRLSSQSGLLSAKEYIMQPLPRMPRRTSDRASSSMTQPRHARTFDGIEEMPGFVNKVNEFVHRLPEGPKKYNKLVYRATATQGEPEVMLHGAADESYVRACLIRAVEGVSEVAADLGIGTEYIDGGSGRSASFTDMLVRKCGTSVYADASRLVLGVFEVKGSWQLKLDGNMSLQAALADENLGPSVAKVIQQAYGDAVMDEAPLLLVSNWHTTFLFSRRLDDVRNKTLQVSQWACDSTDVPPLGAFLYVLHRAHQLWHNDAKQQLPRAGVPVTPRSGYEVQLGSRQVQLGTHFDCSSMCLSSSSNRRVFKGLVDGSPAALKIFNVKDHYAMSAFVAEASAYVMLQAKWGVCMPKLLALGRLPHSGVPVLALSLGEPLSTQLLKQHGTAAKACLKGLHKAGFAHGDVRASNFLLIDGKVVVCDLETCCAADEQACDQDLDRLDCLLNSSS